VTAPGNLPEGFTLDNSFLHTTAATALFGVLSETVPWQTHPFVMFGRSVKMPREIAWFGTHAYRYSRITHPAAPMPAVIAALSARVAEATGQPYNGVLLNRYRHGRDSMGWHADDDYDAGPHSGVASVSLGATRRFRLRTRGEPRQSLGVDLTDGSLLFMAPGTQQRWQHAITRTARPVGIRINLTFRHLQG
jgi:alkylated DNA repair dioxygenase AlkB